MNDKKRMIDAPDEIPLLEQERIEYMGEDFRRRRIRRILSSRIIKISFLCAILLLVFFVIIFVVKEDLFKKDDFSEDNTDKTDEIITDPQSDTSSVSDTEASVTVPVDTFIPSDNKNTMTLDKLYSFDYSLVPENASAILPMDLSMASSGVTYINNMTGLVFDAAALLSKKFNSNEYEMLSAVQGPRVLIVHTHSSEAYSEDGAIFYENGDEEIARSDDSSQTVVSLGKIMSNVLNENGISTVHCTLKHDSIQYKDSYLRSEKTILEYLEKYPTIELVIDLHRDSVMKPSGELIRPVTLVDFEAVAQVRCIVGSNWGGEACPSWQDNLSLALKLRERLNAEYMNLCRPTELRENTYNQELSKYSMTIEIGSAGNSIEEAERAVELVANAIVYIFSKI